MNANQVPKRAGALCLFKEHFGSDFSDFTGLNCLNRLVIRRTQRPQSNLGWFVIKELNQDQNDNPTQYPRDDEGAAKTVDATAEEVDDQQHNRNCNQRSNTLRRLQQPHANA